jgi:peptide/nickel transport system substrate-binding protein
VTRILASSAVTCAAALLVLFCAWSSVSPGKAQDGRGAQVSGSDDLLRAVPFDRITLSDGTVLIVDPVTPRPLPALDPSKEGKRRRRDSKSAIPEEGNIIIGKPTKIETSKSQEEADKDETGVDEVKLHLQKGAVNEVTDFKVKRVNIKKIEYFEDLLLQESERLVMAHDYARAFECCLRVRTRHPGWRGLDEAVNRVLFTEGSQALIAGDGERGLRLLRELLSRKRDYPGLLDQIGAAYGKRIERALSLGMYPLGRRVLHELVELAPEAAIVKEMRALFIAKSSERVKEADASIGPRRLDALVEALRIWPTLDGVEGRYREAFAAEPTLEVAVTDVSTPLGPWVRSPADARMSHLLYRPILASDDDESRQGKRPEQLAAAIESSDLGRRLVIRIRPGFIWSDGSRPVSAIDVGRYLIDRTDPHSTGYEARWADLLDHVEVSDETRLEIRLNHAPLKAGAWLLGPVGPAHAGADGRVATSSQDRPLVSDGPFRCVTATADLVELRRAGDDHSSTGGATAPPPAEAKSSRPPSDGGPARPGLNIKRIREIRIPRGQSAIGVLRRGDSSLVDHVPPDQVESLTAAKNIKVGVYTKPVVHVIALDGRIPALRSRSLRRGLSYAIDRKGLLEDQVLKHPPSGADAVADGPFPKGTYADAPGVKPLESHMWLAKMLVAAARKELHNAPIKLNFEYPAIAEVQAIVEKLAASFREAGIEIVTAEVRPSQLESELRAGRRFELAYRILRCDEPVLDAGLLICPGYDAPAEADALASVTSPRILQLLLQLERAAEWPSARGLALQIDRESRDELPVIPLWQLVDHFAWRDRLTGPAKSTALLYQEIETWQITPWIARDAWDTH